MPLKKFQKIAKVQIKRKLSDYFNFKMLSVVLWLIIGIFSYRRLEDKRTISGKNTFNNKMIMIIMNEMKK